MRRLAQARNPYARSWLWIPDSLAMLAIRNDRVYRPKNPGAHADGPTLPGGRSTFPKKSRGAGALDWTGRGFFGFGGALGAAAVPSGETEADGGSPFACSRPTSRRGQAKSFARPAGGASGAPLSTVLAGRATRP